MTEYQETAKQFQLEWEIYVHKVANHTIEAAELFDGMPCVEWHELSDACATATLENLDAPHGLGGPEPWEV